MLREPSSAYKPLIVVILEEKRPFMSHIIVPLDINNRLKNRQLIEKLFSHSSLAPENYYLPLYTHFYGFFFQNLKPYFQVDNAQFGKGRLRPYKSGNNLSKKIKK